MVIENRLKTVEESHTTLVATVTEIKDDTAAIIVALKGAGKVGMFIKKHGPRLFAFSMGVLVASGYVSPDTAKHIAHLLGL